MIVNDMEVKPEFEKLPIAREYNVDAIRATFTRDLAKWCSDTLLTNYALELMALADELAKNPAIVILVTSWREALDTYEEKSRKLMLSMARGADEYSVNWNASERDYWEQTKEKYDDILHERLIGD